MFRLDITSISFSLVYVLTLLIFYWVYCKPKKILFFILLWSLFQLMLAKSEFYRIDSFQELPKFGVLLLFPTILILFGVFSKRGKEFYQNKRLSISPLIHTIRIPMEFILYSFYLKGLLSKEMTFEGYNFDILAGITALLMFIFFRDFKKYSKLLLVWNYFGLLLIFTILFMGVTSNEVTYRFFGYSQPNIAVTLMPYILLPSVIVPIVIYNHITDIKLLRNNNFLS